jgi:uncharacterized membrane protein
MASIAGGIVLILGYFFLEQLYYWFLGQSTFVIILVIVFLLSLIYSMFYWFSAIKTNKIIDDISNEESRGNPAKAVEIKKYLSNKVESESYIIRFFQKSKNK